jgi:antitoxin (DNA-binding transcriptional repressor) of toxin-antitoxin stability system
LRRIDVVTTGDYYDRMKAVGIKQLKARLSEYVRLARAGETILVSDRDEVVAELGPPRHQPGEPDSLAALLERLADRGWLTRSSRTRSQWDWRPPALDLPPEAVDRLLDELREDRLG